MTSDAARPTDIVKVALAAGHAVVATGRDPERAAAAIGAHNDLPFSIHTMVVEPGFFRTDLLTPESTTYAEPSIEDYAQRTTQTVASWTSMNGKQSGDPVKLAGALIKLVSQDEAPVRWVAGADAVQTVGNKGRDLIAQADAYRNLSSSLAHDDD